MINRETFFRKQNFLQITAAVGITPSMNKKINTHTLLLLSLILGVVLGLSLHPHSENQTLTFLTAQVFAPLGQIFLKLIFMVVVPMIFSALVLGVYELGSARGIGSVFGKTLALTLITSAASVIIGITLVNVFQPGAGMPKDLVSIDTQAVSKIQSNADSSKELSKVLIDLIPRNPLEAAVKAFDGEMLSFMVFTLLFGFAISLTAQKQTPQTLLSLCQNVFDACLKIVEIAMKLAPFAVFALVFNTSIKFGPDIFKALSFYVALVIFGLCIQQFVVYSGLLKFLANKSPLEFFKQTREVMLYAFATASSNATLPKSLHAAEHNLRLNPASSRFVLTVGSTANQNGTALFEGITVLFLAQVYGVDLSMAQQVFVIVMSILAGVGTAGVPGGSLPLIMILMQQVGIPAEGMGIILGVDRLLDMCRTTVNVTGDLVIASVVSAKTPKAPNG
jgi:DAACS family dicarboxylate/amino acid:cation (Na+ or H+) symporter